MFKEKRLLALQIMSHDRMSNAKTNTAQQETMNTKHEVFVTIVFFYLQISFLQMPPWYGQLVGIGGFKQISA